EPFREEPAGTREGAKVVRLFPEPVRERRQEPEQGARGFRNGSAAPEDLPRTRDSSQRAGATRAGVPEEWRRAAAAVGQSQRLNTTGWHYSRPASSYAQSAA